jgi:hypothetical protein
MYKIILTIDCPQGRFTGEQTDGGYETYAEAHNALNELLFLFATEHDYPPFISIWDYAEPSFVRTFPTTMYCEMVLAGKVEQVSSNVVQLKAI